MSTDIETNTLEKVVENMQESNSSLENTNAPGQNNKLVSRKSSKKLLPIGVGIFAVIIAVAVIITISISRDGHEYNNNIRAAEKYITELDYASAISTYKAAIAIDPSIVDAYLGLIDVYCKLAEVERNHEDYDTALAYYETALTAIQDGINNTGVSEMFDSIKSDIESMKMEIDYIKVKVEEETAEVELQKQINDAIKNMKSDVVIGWCCASNSDYRLISGPEDCLDDGAYIYYFFPENGQMAKGLTEIDGIKYKFDGEDGRLKKIVPSIEFEEISFDFLDTLQYDKYAKQGMNIVTIYDPPYTISSYSDYANKYTHFTGYDLYGNYRGEIKIPDWMDHIERSTKYTYSITDDYFFIIYGNCDIDTNEFVDIHAYRTSDYTETYVYNINDRNIVNAYHHDLQNSSYGLYVRQRNDVFDIYYRTSGEIFMSFKIDEIGKFVIVDDDAQYDYPIFDGYVVYEYDVNQSSYLICAEDRFEWGYGSPDGTVICTFMDATGFTHDGYALVSKDRHSYDLIDSDYDVIAEGIVLGVGASTDGYMFNVVGPDNEKRTYRIVES